MTALSSLIASLFMAQTGPIEPTITYTCPGKNAKAVFEDLSKQAGQTLLIGQSLADEPIILRLDKAPLSKTMDRLAFALNGEWKEEKEGKRLVAKKLPADATPYNARLRRIIESQKTAKEQFANSKPFDAKTAADYAKELEEHVSRVDGLPTNDSTYFTAGIKLANRALKATIGQKIFSVLDSKLLAEIGPYERIVWSSYPTAKQRQLPPEALKLAIQFFRESQIWGKELLNRPELVAKMKDSRANFFNLVPSGLSEQNGSFVSAVLPAKVNVVASSRSEIVGSIILVYFDSRGKVLFESASGINTSIAKPPAKVVEPILKPIDKAILLDPIATEFCMATYKSFNGGTHNKVIALSAELTKKLDNPEARDPLSIAAGPALIQYAAAKNEQLVAVLNDSVVLGVRANDNGIVDQILFLRYFSPFGREHKVEESEGWMAIGVDAVSQAESWRNTIRIPRRPLSNFLRQVKADGYVSIESTASLLAHLGPNTENAPLYLVVLILELQGIDTEILQDTRMRTAMRLVSSLSPLQGVAIRNGETLSFGSLSELQKSILRHELYVKAPSPVTIEIDNSKQSDDDSQEIDYYPEDPTERFVPDINPKAVLRFEENSQPRISITEILENGRRATQQIQVDKAGQTLAFRQWADHKFENLQVWQHRTVSIRLNLSANAHMVFTVSETARNGPIVDSIDKLPPEIAKRIRDDMAKFKPPNPFLWKQAS